MANFYPCISITGTTGALKAIHGNDVAEADTAMVVLSTGYVHFYGMDLTSGETEDIPAIVAPTTAAGDKRWIEKFCTKLAIQDLTETYYASIISGDTLTANRTLTLILGDASRQITLSGNPTLADWFNQSVKTTASPTFANITDSGLTASLPVFTDGDKKLVSKTVEETLTAINVEDGADVTDAVNVGTSIHGADAKTSMADADKVAIIDTEASNVLKTLSWAYVKSILKTYFDTLYNKYVHPNHSGDVTSVADGEQTIANKAVTLAKMNDMATASLLGRNTAGAGVPEVLSKATALSLLNVEDGANQYTLENHASNHTDGTDDIQDATDAQKGLATSTQITKLDAIAEGATANAKATGTEVDTGTDDDKFNTPKALKDSHNVPSVAPSTSGNVLTSDGTDWTSAAPAVTLANEVTLTNKTIQLAENAPIFFDEVLSADGKYSGMCIAGTAGATLAFGNICYYKAADSQWYLAKADATATSGAVKLGFCVLAADDNDDTRMLLFGNIRADSLFDTFTLSAPVFVSAATAGKIVTAAPTGTTNFVVRIVGHSHPTTNEVFVNISPDYLELA